MNVLGYIVGALMILFLVYETYCLIKDIQAKREKKKVEQEKHLD